MFSQDAVNLGTYDLILINTSGGKDSSVAAHYVVGLAEAFGVKDRVVMVHATFAEEWPGTVELVKRQAGALGVPLKIVSRGEGLLDYVKRRGMWPSSQQRYCTSDFKRAPIDKVITRRATSRWGTRRMRVLNVMGIRAAESPARAKRVAFERDTRRSNGKRIVDTWLPIFRLSTQQVWDIIREHNLEQHPAYKLGMPRLSCCFCIFAPKPALILAGKHNLPLLREYAKVEAEIGHAFRQGLKINEVLAAVEAEEAAGPVNDWTM